MAGGDDDAWEELFGEFERQFDTLESLMPSAPTDYDYQKYFNHEGTHRDSFREGYVDVGFDSPGKKKSPAEKLLAAAAFGDLAKVQMWANFFLHHGHVKFDPRVHHLEESTIERKEGGFDFEYDEFNCITAIHRGAAVDNQELQKGDRIITVKGRWLSEQDQERFDTNLEVAVPIQIGVWKYPVIAMERKVAATPIFNEALRMACKRNNADVVRTMMEMGADPTVLDAKGLSAMHHAAQLGHFKCLHVLCEYGVDTNLPGKKQTPMELAIMGAHEKAIRLLIKASSGSINNKHNGRTPLHIAALCSSEEVLRMLVNGGAKLDIRSKHGWDALFMAISQGRTNMVQCLLDLGANLNSEVNGRRPLHHAACCGHQGMMQWLVKEKEVDVNERSSKKFRTAVHWAACGGQADAIQFLIGLGANPFLEDADKATALSLAKDDDTKIAVGVAYRYAGKRHSELFLQACKEGVVDGARALVDMNRELPDMELNICYQDENGYNGLHWAQGPRWLTFPNFQGVRRGASNTNTIVSRPGMDFGCDSICGTHCISSSEAVSGHPGALQNGGRLGPLHWATANAHAPVVDFLLQLPPDQALALVRASSCAGASFPPRLGPGVGTRDVAVPKGTKLSNWRPMDLAWDPEVKAVYKDRMRLLDPAAVQNMKD